MTTTTTTTTATPGSTARTGTTVDAGRVHVVPILAEAALVLVSVVTVLSLGRLFDASSYRAPLLTTALVAHGTAIVLRRTRLGPLPVVAIAVAGGAVVLTWLRYWDTTFAGLPSWATLSIARQDLADAWRQFGETVAPAPVFPGFVLAAGIAVWVAAWVSDWAAFRLGSAVEAVLPQAAIFLFVSLLGDPRSRTSSTVAFVAAALAFVLLHRVADQVTAATWVGDGRRQGPPAVVAVGLGMIAVAVLAAAVAGPRAPGVGADPMLDWHGGRVGDGTRVTVSPLVDIRKRLVDQSDVEAFSVRSPRPSYWRLTSLDAFDGTVWSSSGSFGRADGDLPANFARDYENQVVQDYRVSGLDAIWLPAAYRPVDVATDGTDVRYDPLSSTLIVDKDSDTSDGITYRVTSDLPRFDKEDLDRNDGADVPGTIRDRYLDLPGDFPEEVHAQAQEIMRPGANPYQRARRLQDWFRTNFTYDLTGTSAGHSEQAIEDFLASRRGYCEQFAGTFAAMARSMLIPARVAVGFTWGELDPESDVDRYIVRGRNAHAWPEVWINQAGWVPFEPTPGRGAPGAESWTGAPEEQDIRDSSITTASTPTTGPEDTIPTSAPDNNRLPNEEVATGGAGSGGSGSGPSSPLVRAGGFVLAAGLAAAAWVGLLAAGRATRTRLRRRRATTDAARVRVAWLEGAEAVGRIAPPLRPAETHTEFAARVRPVIGPASRPLHRLAGLATTSEWSDQAVAPDTVTDAEGLTREIEKEIRESLELKQKVLALVDPRTLAR